MSDLPVLYVDDSVESSAARRELDRLNVAFVPMFVGNSPTRLPALSVGNQLFIGLSDISLYFLRTCKKQTRKLA